MIGLDELRAAAAKMHEYSAPEPYTVVMHASAWLDIRRVHARWTWYEEYRQWRRLRRKGVQIETLREVMDGVRGEVDRLATQLRPSRMSGEVGTYESFRFIFE